MTERRPSNLAVVVASLGLACLSPGAPSIATSAGAVETVGTTGAGNTTTTATDTAATDTAATDTAATDTAATDTAATDTASTASFLASPDLGSRPHEWCDPYAQECPEGEKCAPWSEDDYSWYGTAICVPLPRDPKQPGEPCMIEGGLYSGVDDCAEGAICWNVDPETHEGTCVALCVGPGGEGECLVDPFQCCPPDKACESNRVFGICVIPCHPLADLCPNGDVCYPVGDSFVCAPDVGGEMGAVGDPCEFINVCDPGTFCGNPAAYPGCDPNAAGCCVPFCDLKAPACADGTVCTPWYDPNDAPALYKDLGACMIPG